MKNKRKRDWYSIYRLLKPQMGAIVFLNLLAVLQALTQVALAVVTKAVIDAAIYGNGQLLQWSLVLGGVLLLLVVMHMLHNWYTGSTADKCVAKMRLALLDAAAHSSKERLHSYHSGALLSRGMEDVHTVCDGFVVTLPSVCGQLSRLIGAFSSVMILYPTIAPLLILASLIVIAGTAVIRPVMRRQHRQVRAADEQVMAGMQENLQQLELIQGLQMEQTTRERFAEKLDNTLRKRKIRRYWSVGVSSSISLMSQMGTGALLLWGAVQVANRQLSFGSLTAMLELLALLRSPVLGLSGIWNRIAAIEVAAGRLKELLDSQVTSPGVVTDTGKVHAVVFENVSFRYPGEEQPVLENFNARFPLDRWACLTGISGKGKSTIFKLILGIYEPQEGSVLLETDNGKVLCGAELRHLFAYVPQDYSLFSGSIRENLLLAAPDADVQRRKTALATAQADFVWELSAGEETQVLENSGLSKGQLQRLAIARAVLMDRQILLLDECTSALDAGTEEALLADLAVLNKQAILVTHRPDALRDAPGVTFVKMDQ